MSPLSLLRQRAVLSVVSLSVAVTLAVFWLRAGPKPEYLTACVDRVDLESVVLATGRLRGCAADRRERLVKCGAHHTCADYLYTAGDAENTLSRRLILGEDIEPMIFEAVNAAPDGYHREATQPGGSHGDNRRWLLPILSGLTFSTVAVLASLIVWASLT